MNEKLPPSDNSQKYSGVNKEENGSDDDFAGLNFLSFICFEWDFRHLIPSLNLQNKTELNILGCLTFGDLCF